MLRAIHELWADQEGTATVEYALLVVLVVVGCVGAWSRLSGLVGNALNGIEDSLQQ